MWFENENSPLYVLIKHIMEYNENHEELHP